MYRESISAIMKANKDDPDLLDFIESRVNSFVEYVGHVNYMETRIQRLTIQGVTGDEWRDAVSALDERRRDKHEMALSAATQLNRLATASGLPLFYDGPIDNEHRKEVGDLCQTVINEYFNGRHTKPLTISDMMSEEDTNNFVAAVSELSATTNTMTVI